jgi:hypothetical protein
MIVTETMGMVNNYLYYAFNKVNLFRLISFSRAGNCKCTGQFFYEQLHDPADVRWLSDREHHIEQIDQ